MDVNKLLKGVRIKYSHKAITLGVLAITIAGGSLFAVSAASAETKQSDDLASRIATKFNLKQADVKGVVDQYHSEKQAEHKADRQKGLEERLTQAVADGKLTEEQKTKILDYLKSQESFMESLKGKTGAERKSAMEAHRAEVKKWASDNGIDEKYVMMGGPGRGHGGPRPDHGDMKSVQ